MKITSIALAALPLAAAAAEQLAGGLPVDCVAFQDADSPSLESSTASSTLGMGRCLQSGDAICSSTGSWAFGIDRTDGTVKLWEDDRVLFASSEWAHANALCIGGNADEYGPHEYDWYDEAAPYLFVSYDAGRSKAFLDCSSGGLASAHLEINHIAQANIRMSGAPIVAFQDGAGTSSLWSIDAWGAAQTNSGCEWRTDAVDFTAELAAGEDFSSQMDELVGLKQEEDEGAEDGTRTKKYMRRPDMRDRWGGDDKDGDDNGHYDRTRWGEVLQARKGGTGEDGRWARNESPTCSPKSTKAPSAGKGSNITRKLSTKSTKTPTAGSSPTRSPTASSSSKSSKCSDKSPKSSKSASATVTPTKPPSKSVKSPKSATSPGVTPNPTPKSPKRSR